MKSRRRACGCFCLFKVGLTIIILTLMLLHWRQIWDGSLLRLPFKRTLRWRGPLVSREKDADVFEDKRPARSTTCQKPSSCRHHRGQLLFFSGPAAYIAESSDTFSNEITIKLTEKYTKFSFILSETSSFSVEFQVEEDEQNGIFEDFTHETNDNFLILNASEKSPFFGLKSQLQEQINGFCRFPIPKRYILTMMPYLDRPTKAYFNASTCRFERSVNDPCSYNPAMPLEHQRNSLYCAANCPLARDLFNETLMDAYVDQGDERCDTARRICQSCMLRSCGLKHVDWNMQELSSRKSGYARNCCQIQCFASTHCIQYFSTSCYPTERAKRSGSVCLRGKTLKFTLTPDFKFGQEVYECHVKRMKNTDRLHINMSITFSARTQPHRRTTPVGGQLPAHTYFHSVSIVAGVFTALLDNLFSLYYKGNTPTTTDAVLVKSRQKSAFATKQTEPLTSRDDVDPSKLPDQVEETPKYLYQLVDLTKRIVAVHENVKVFRHREQKYVVVQNVEPFQYNSDNWSSKGCFVNISDGLNNVKKSNGSDGIPVKLQMLRKSPSDGRFRYDLRLNGKERELRVSVRGVHHDLMTAIFCHHPSTSLPGKVHTLLRDKEHSLRLKVVDLQRHRFAWHEKVAGASAGATRIHALLTGWLTGTPAFISIKITLIYRSQNIFYELRNPHYNLTEHGLIDKDIVLFRPDATAQHDSAESSPQNKFFLRFEVDLFDELGSASESDFIVLLVYVSDCVRTERVQAVLQTTSAVDQPPATQRPIAVQKTSNPAPPLPGTMLIDTHGMHTPLPFLLLSVFLGSLYMILFLAFVLLCLCRPRKRQLLFPVMSLSPKDGDARRTSNTSAFTDLANSSTSALMNSEGSAARMHTPEDGHGGGKMQLRRLPADQTVTSRKLVIFFYVCFRAFTILLFTFSVGLSLILSLESSSFKILLACMQNVKGDRVRDLVSLERAGKILPGSPRLASHWLQELRKIEQTSMSELRKQTQQFINQSVACEMQEIRSSGELGLTMEELANLVVLQTQLTSRNGQTDDGTQYLLQIHSVVNATWRQIQAEYWQHYNFSVHGYMESVRSLLDNLLMQHWAPYETLLDRMMDNAWLSAARRAMDSPNDALRTVNEAGDTADRFSMRSNSVNYLAGLTPVKPREVSTLTFSGFLGIPQPANARLAEARLWNKCRQNIPEVQPLQEFVSQFRTSPQLAIKTNLPDPFLFYAYSQAFTADDLDVFRRPAFSGPGARYELPSLHLSKLSKAGHETLYLHDWINAAYLRIFLLFLDAYLIVSRFYGACQNFYILWLGKRRRILSQPSHHQTQRAGCNPDLNGGRKLYTPQIYEREHQDEMLLDKELELSNRRSLGDQASFVRSAENNPDLIQTVMHVTKNISPDDHLQSLDGRLPSEQSVMTYSLRDREDPRNKAINDVTSQFESHKYLNDGEIFWDISSEKPSAAPDKRTTTEFLTFSQRRGLPACCCCLDFHYLLILTGVFFVFLGLALSFSAERNVTNNWLLKRSALLSRLRAIDDYRKLTRNTVDYVQLGYLNTRRLRLERINTEKQLQRLKRLQSRLNYEKDFQARQHLQEICFIADSEEHASQRVRTIQESSLCQSLNQKRSLSYHIAPLGILPTIVTEQLKLPICAFLPISSAAEVYLGKQINKSSQKAKNKTEQYAPLISQRDQQQLQLLLFKHSTFAAFVTGIYRLCLTTILLGVCVCWLLACKYLIAQMCSRTVSVLTNRVTLITTCPPSPRKIETFLASNHRNLFHRSTLRTIWLPEPERTSDPVRPPRAQRPQGGRKHKPKCSKPHEKQSTESRV